MKALVEAYTVVLKFILERTYSMNVFDRVVIINR